MQLLADENADTEWIHALRDDGHDVVRVVDVGRLGVAATDPEVLSVAAELDRVLLTSDQSDFTAPPFEDHAGILSDRDSDNRTPRTGGLRIINTSVRQYIVIVADATRTGGEIRRAVRRIERSYPDLSGRVAYVSDWC